MTERHREMESEKERGHDAFMFGPLINISSTVCVIKMQLSLSAVRMCHNCDVAAAAAAAAVVVATSKRGTKNP